MQSIWIKIRSIVVWYFRRPIWQILLSLPVILLLIGAAGGATWLGSRLLVSPYPIHLHHPKCDNGSLAFSPYLSDRYHEQVRAYLVSFDTSYAVIGNKIYTARNTDFAENIHKPVWVLAHPDKQGNRTLRAQDHKTHALFREWDALERGPEKRRAWCRVVEAIVSPTGINIDARRSRPDIWPDGLK